MGLSYPPEEVIEHCLRVCREESVREIWLTGEDVGAYGSDLNRMRRVKASLERRNKERSEAGENGEGREKEEQRDEGAEDEDGSYTAEMLSRIWMPPTKERIVELLGEEWGEESFEGEWSLPRLGIAIARHVPAGVAIRIGQTNPNHLARDGEGYVKLFSEPNVYKLAHIPVQSGSDSVLQQMRRPYTVGQFRELCEALRAGVPGIMLLTDIICGHPGEKDEDFEETVKLMREVQFPFVNITQMYPRKGTAAFGMERVPTRIVKERSRELTRVVQSIAPLDALVVCLFFVVTLFSVLIQCLFTLSSISLSMYFAFQHVFVTCSCVLGCCFPICMYVCMCACVYVNIYECRGRRKNMHCLWMYRLMDSF